MNEREYSPENCRVEGIACAFLRANEGRKIYCGFNGDELSQLTFCPSGLGPVWRPKVFERLSLKQAIQIITPKEGNPQ